MRAKNLILPQKVHLGHVKKINIPNYNLLAISRVDMRRVASHQSQKGIPTLFISPSHWLSRLIFRYNVQLSILHRLTRKWTIWTVFAFQHFILQKLDINEFQPKVIIHFQCTPICPILMWFSSVSSFINDFSLETKTKKKKKYLVRSGMISMFFWYPETGFFDILPPQFTVGRYSIIDCFSLTTLHRK